jgi:hypothetical protein
MIRVVERAKKLLLKITIVGYIKALSPIVYNEEKCKRRESFDISNNGDL